MTGTLALLTIGGMISGLKIDAENQTDLGFILALNTVLPCIAATFCFYVAGQHYTIQMKQMKIEKTEALEVAASHNLIMSKQNID